MPSPTLIPVVLCGGNGTRLWPLSRGALPKQYLSLDGGSHSLLQRTVLRLAGLGAATGATVAPPLLVCNAEQRFLVAQQLQDIGVSDARILLEPAGRNTAPALTLAALACEQTSQGDAVLLVLPADHHIGQPEHLHAAVGQALGAAAEGAMLAFGVRPERPETGYGYIRRGAAVGDGVWQIDGFTEKPDAATASAWIAEGQHFWNAGLFAVRADVWLRALSHTRPDIAAACRRAMQGVQRDLDFWRPDGEAFAASPSDSIDYAVMERLPAQPALGIPARMVALDADWSDVGAWDAVWALSPHDPQGNAVIGQAVLQGCSGTLAISSSGRLIAGLGLRDTVVVETPDAVLVADRSQAQRVKDLVADVRAVRPELAESHRHVHRPWGWFDALDRGPGFQVKRIVVLPGASLSLQKHTHRAEHWVVVRGLAEVTRGTEVFRLGANASTYIPPGEVHRLANVGSEPLEIIEVQSGSYLGEDDIVRLDDPYQRGT